MKIKLTLLLFVLLLGAPSLYAAAADPCLSPQVPKQSVAIGISSATTTQLIALETGKAIYVCGWNFTAVIGTGATYLFQYGTGTTCGTGTVALTGAMIGNGGPNVYSAPSGI